MKERQFVIRNAKREDIDEIRRLIELSVRVLQQNDYSASQIDGALGHALGLDIQLVDDGTYFVASPAFNPDVIAGCGGWSFRRTLFGSDDGPKREEALLDPATEPAKIRAIFVHPKWARKGLGTFLLEHSEQAARQAGFRALEMGSTLTGLPLYSLRGYVKQAEVAVPLPNGDVLPIIHMVKRLSG